MQDGYFQAADRAMPMGLDHVPAFPLPGPLRLACTSGPGRRGRPSTCVRGRYDLRIALGRVEALGAFLARPGRA